MTHVPPKREGAPDIEDLWARPLGGKVQWLSTVPSDLRTWLDGIADLIIEGELEPNWNRVLAGLKSHWPRHVPSKNTVTDTVRRLVEERRGSA